MPGQYRRPVSTSHTSNQRDIEDYPSPYTSHNWAIVVVPILCYVKAATNVGPLGTLCAFARCHKFARMQVMPSVCLIICLTVTRRHPATDQQKLPSQQLRAVALLQVFETTQAG